METVIDFFMVRCGLIVQWDVHRDRRPGPGPAGNGTLPADVRQALLHVLQTVTTPFAGIQAGVRGRRGPGSGKAMAVVRDFDHERPAINHHLDLHARGTGMLQHIIQGLFKSQEYIVPHFG